MALHRTATNTRTAKILMVAKKSRHVRSKFTLPIACLLATLSNLMPLSLAEAGDRWLTGYYVNNLSKTLPLSAVPWNKYTHIIHFGVEPTFDDTDGDGLGDTPGINIDGRGIRANMSAFVNLAHAHGVKALASLLIIYDRNTSVIASNTSDAYIDEFVEVLKAFIEDNNYDGIDIDWEGPASVDIKNQLPKFITKLRAAIPDKLITIAGVLQFRSIYAKIVDQVDQINIMTYDMDTTDYDGKRAALTGLNSSTRKGSSQVFGVTTNNKSQEEYLRYFIDSAGLPAAKLGVGVPFYNLKIQVLRSDIEAFATGPRQPRADTRSVRTRVPDLLTSVYWAEGVHIWDDDFKTSYISYDVAGLADDAYISYTSQQQIEEVVKLAYEKNLGGIMTFALSHEYIPSQTDDHRYPLSTALHNNMRAIEGLNVNIAEGKSATQSSVSYGAIADRAVDGNTDGLFENNSVTHTDSSATTQQWWEVDLGESYAIDQIKVWNRTAAVVDRLSNYTVTVLDEDKVPVWSNFQINYPDPSTTLMPAGATGHYVRISGPLILSLAEVQVYPTLKNIAEGKPSTQSSTSFQATADRAVDGNTDGLFGNNSVTHTNSGLSTPQWWEVDLGESYTIDQIKVWNRTAVAANRLSNYTVTILDENKIPVWSNFQTNYPDPSIALAPSGIKGHYVKISGPKILSLAEVQVIGY